MHPLIQAQVNAAIEAVRLETQAKAPPDELKLGPGIATYVTQGDVVEVTLKEK